MRRLRYYVTERCDRCGTSSRLRLSDGIKVKTKTLYTLVGHNGSWSGSYCKRCKLIVERVKEKQIDPKADICEILSKHHTVLQDDPDRLSTSFIKRVIGEGAEHCDDLEEDDA